MRQGVPGLLSRCLFGGLYWSRCSKFNFWITQVVVFFGGGMAAGVAVAQQHH